MDSYIICPICTEDLENKNQFKLLCGHIYHTECIYSWILRKRSCPICRSRVDGLTATKLLSKNIRVDIDNTLMVCSIQQRFDFLYQGLEQEDKKQVTFNNEPIIHIIRDVENDNENIFQRCNNHPVCDRIKCIGCISISIILFGFSLTRILYH